MYDELTAGMIRRLAETEAKLSSAEATIKSLRDALADALAGFRYIRQSHGDLYGVGWDRIEAYRALLAKDASG